MSAFIFIRLFRYLKWLQLEEYATDNMLMDTKKEYDKLKKENQELKSKINSGSQII